LTVRSQVRLLLPIARPHHLLRALIRTAETAAVAIHKNLKNFNTRRLYPFQPIPAIPRSAFPPSPATLKPP